MSKPGEQTEICPTCGGTKRYSLCVTGHKSHSNGGCLECNDPYHKRPVRSAAPVVTHDPNCGCPTCAPWEPDAVVSQLEPWYRKSWTVLEDIEVFTCLTCDGSFWMRMPTLPNRCPMCASPTPVVSGQADTILRLFHEVLLPGTGEFEFDNEELCEKWIIATRKLQDYMESTPPSLPKAKWVSAIFCDKHPGWRYPCQQCAKSLPKAEPCNQSLKEK